MVMMETPIATPWDYAKEEIQTMPSINSMGAPLSPVWASTWEQLNAGQHELYTTKNESLNHSHGTQSIDT